MRQRTPLLEWQFVEKNGDSQDAPWPPLVATPSATVATHVATHSPLYRRFICEWSLALLLFLVTTGAWLWQRAERGLAQVEAELKDAVQLELATATPDHAHTVRELSAGAAAKGWESQLAVQVDTVTAVSILDQSERALYPPVLYPPADATE